MNLLLAHRRGTAKFEDTESRPSRRRDDHASRIQVSQVGARRLSSGCHPRPTHIRPTASAAFIITGLYLVTQCYQEAEDRARGDRTIAPSDPASSGLRWTESGANPGTLSPFGASVRARPASRRS